MNTQTTQPGGIRPWMFFLGVAIIAATIYVTGREINQTMLDDYFERDSIAALNATVDPISAPSAVIR